MSDPSTLNPANDQLLPRQTVRRRYSVSEMALYRWEHHPDPEFGFPKAVYIGNRAYYKLSELLDFERRCAARGPATRTADMPEGRRRFRGRKKRTTKAVE
jgi:hypothetical protein